MILHELVGGTYLLMSSELTTFSSYFLASLFIFVSSLQSPGYISSVLVAAFPLSLLVVLSAFDSTNRYISSLSALCFAFQVFKDLVTISNVV
ncbi:hypothetical protein BDZ45DRAFT_54733 [Acephala macrosclerotiorum]|nr:hypothetical protein BDZ45DRAFT_54733 [Acephala macrosclerotiorum]